MRLEAGIFALRTPMLPFDELEAWGAGLSAPAAARDDPEGLEAAVAADRALLRRRLDRLLLRPEVREALFVASPNLETGIAAWRREPDGKKGVRAEQALVRYFARMAARATPFGLFSGCAVGRIGEESRLELAGREGFWRRTRLDMDYLYALAEELGRSPELRHLQRYRANSSLYRVAGRLRYAEARALGTARVHQLVGVDTNGYLDQVLDRVSEAAGASWDELAETLVAADPEGEISREEAEEFVDELIDSQILVSDLAPPVTGREAVDDLIAQLSSHRAGPIAGRLERVREQLARLDAGGLGADPATYRGIASLLGELPASIDLQRLFQVDLFRAAPAATLGPEVLAEIERGIDLLDRIAPPLEDGPLSRFRQEFVERYERGREVPLVEVLDEEIGIGFDRSHGAGTEGSPLLAGLVFPARPVSPSFAGGPGHDLLLDKLGEALAAGRPEIELTAADLPARAGDQRPRLPDAFHVLAAVATRSPEALAKGDFKLHLRTVYGPSGARLLGRFCHADEALHRGVEAHLRAEEALDPETVFAEIVHLPEGRVGNILWRPVLRSHEIPFLGRSGAAPERQLPITDLRVTVIGQEIVLRSARLGRRVVPCLTSAHDFGHRSLGVYRFLCSLQTQGIRPALFWSWGALGGASSLPRVTSGRLVLCRAHWFVPAAEIEPLARAAGGERFRRVQQWRERRRLPRYVSYVERDNELVVDLDNVLSLDAFLAVVKRLPGIQLAELFPGPDELGATGPEGRFVHELLIPCVARREAVERRPLPSSAVPVRRTFPPGSEWLYAKLYTGTSTADQVLREAVAPVIREALGTGTVDRWFFLRYSDPHWHLRLRLHGTPGRLHGEVLPLLEQAAARLLDGGRIWRFQLDTYEREVERYGGPEGIELAERLFQADSEAALAIVESLEGIDGADLRWRLALRSLDLLLNDLGFQGDGKLALLGLLRESAARELGADAGLIQQLAARLRREREALAGFLAPEVPGDRPEAAPGIAALTARSHRLAPVAAELHVRAAAGRLTVPLPELALSFLHMSANRLLRSEGHAHEMVLYDFLDRLIRSRAARSAFQGGERGATLPASSFVIED